MNFILILIEIIVSYFFLIHLYKKYQQNGLYLYSIITFILAVLTSVKNIEIIGFDIPLGIILVTNLYIASNILVQKNGVELIKKMLSLLTISSTFVISIMILFSAVETSEYNIVINNTYSLMFIDKLRVVLATTGISILSIWLNSTIYYQLKRDKNKLIISNLYSLIITCFIDAILFGLLSFMFVIPISRIIITIALIYILKLLIGLLGIIVAFIAREIKDK